MSAFFKSYKAPELLDLHRTSLNIIGHTFTSAFFKSNKALELFDLHRTSLNIIGPAFLKSNKALELIIWGGCGCLASVGSGGLWHRSLLWQGYAWHVFCLYFRFDRHDHCSPDVLDLKTDCDDGFDVKMFLIWLECLGMLFWSCGMKWFELAGNVLRCSLSKYHLASLGPHMQLEPWPDNGGD